MNQADIGQLTSIHEDIPIIQPEQQPKINIQDVSQATSSTPTPISPEINNQDVSQATASTPPPPIPPEINNQDVSQASSSKSPSPNLPRSDLLIGSRENYIEIGIPLYEASIKGDWKTASEILRKRPDLVRSGITENYETPLHVAASAQRTKRLEGFVRNLVGKMKNEDLELQNKNNNTALALAAAAGNIKMVEIIVEKNTDLLGILGGADKNMLPLYMAALFGNYEVVKYLYEVSQKLSHAGWTHQNRCWLLQKCVEADMFDIALQIVKDRKELAINRNVLEVLARKPDAFYRTKSNFIVNCVLCCFKGKSLEKESKALQLLRIIWDDIAKKPKKEIDDIIRGPPDDIKPDDKQKRIMRRDSKKTYSSRILFIAAEMGNTKFVVELIRKYPDLIWKVDDNNQTIFHIAVKHRHVGIYNLLYEIGSMKDLITPLKDGYDNNMLHLVGKSAKKKRLEDVSGVAFQMQRELLWFKEVENMIPPPYRERKNKDGLTPHELFTEQHSDLVRQGEKWMKGTASQCMVVATLIATIVFAAAFTVPGGYDKDDGIPFFYRNAAFIVFVVADAISLFLSSTSILIFLYILTSRYAERDFLDSLPRKLMLGITTLFLSITTMMIAFSATFFILFHKGLILIPIIITVCAIIPVIVYVVLHSPLVADVISSTIGSKYLFRPKKYVLYYKNPKH